jgi:hypothetical protein
MEPLPKCSFISSKRAAVSDGPTQERPSCRRTFSLGSWCATDRGSRIKTNVREWHNADTVSKGLLEMESFQNRLNSPEYLPEKAYRRNAKIFELICYVNCAMGAWLSGNRSATDLFRERARDYLEKNKPEPEYEKYCALVGDYLDALDRRVK